MKLLEKLRWLLTEIPWPGTAEVSAKSCVLAVLVGETPGTSNARSRKLRPSKERFWTSLAEMVCAIWLRFSSSAGDVLVTLTVVSVPATDNVIGKWKSAPTVRTTAFFDSEKPGWLTSIR